MLIDVQDPHLIARIIQRHVHELSIAREVQAEIDVIRI